MEMSPVARRGLAIAGLVVCLAALLAELVVQATAHIAHGGNLLGALLRFISYYTVGSNLLLVLIYVAHLEPAQGLHIFRDARVRTMAAAMITLVMLVYMFILSRIENPQGWLGKVSVIAAHYIAPPIYLVWWAAALRDDTISMRDLPLMVAPSVAYMGYVLLLGHLTGKYPYAMLNADQLGLLSMVLHGLGMLIALVGACAGCIALARWVQGCPVSTEGQPMGCVRRGRDGKERG